MTTMTDIIAAHSYNFTFMICQCMAGEHTATMDDEAHAAHVAAALETAGYGLVEGEKEWGVFRKSNETQVGKITFDSEEQAAAWIPENYYEKFAIQLEPRSRTVTAWKKEK